MERPNGVKVLERLVREAPDDELTMLRLPRYRAEEILGYIAELEVIERDAWDRGGWAT